MRCLRTTTIILIVLFLGLVFLLAACSGTDDSRDGVSGPDGNADALAGGIPCDSDAGLMRCGDSCIPLDSCCTDADCDLPEKCIDQGCVDPCLDVDCTAPFACEDGSCACPAGQKACDDTCIPDSGCCEETSLPTSLPTPLPAGVSAGSTTVCPNGTVCHDHSCVALCDVVSCDASEYCEAGRCLCKDDYFKAASGACLPLGLCEVDRDCADDESCVSDRCTKNCYSYKEPVQISECFLEQAELQKDVSKCELVKEDKRDLCYFNVAVASQNRKVCSRLQTDPPIEIYRYNQQNCVIAVAKAAHDPDLCANTPSWTNLDPPDLDGYCREEVAHYLESLRIKDIGECGTDCDCRLRYAKRNSIEDCKGVCADDQGECTDYFYFWG
ncbi:MAG: hypothetical protein GXP63_05990 [DPANN group archaeon]|nr:hypothetical protein [DPANN group archaeon]